MLTNEQIERWKADINQMDRIEMANLRRFAPSGHPVFDSQNIGLYEHFERRFKELGGMTSAISKEIGWTP